MFVPLSKHTSLVHWQLEKEIFSYTRLSKFYPFFWEKSRVVIQKYNLPSYVYEIHSLSMDTEFWGLNMNHWKRSPLIWSQFTAFWKICKRKNVSETSLAGNLTFQTLLRGPGSPQNSSCLSPLLPTVDIALTPKKGHLPREQLFCKAWVTACKPAWTHLWETSCGYRNEPPSDGGCVLISSSIILPTVGISCFTNPAPVPTFFPSNRRVT